MGVAKSSTVCLAVLFIMGCADPPPPQKTVFDPMTRQLDRARDVQNTVDRNADQTRRTVDGQEPDDAQKQDPSQERDGQDHGDSRP